MIPANYNLWHFSIRLSPFCRPSLLLWALVSASGVSSTCWKVTAMIMKKKIRLLAVCAIMLCGMIVGGIAKPAEVMAKQTIKATREMKDAPKIQLDKLYHIAANDSPQAGKADILAWNSHEWNYYDFVTVKLTEKTNLTLFAQETGGSDCWIQLYNSDGERVGEEYNVGTRSGILKRTEKYSLMAGTYYLGLQPHATADIQLKSEKKIVLSEKKVILEPGDKTTIDAVLKKSDKVVKNTKFTYKSTKTSVAKVSSKGKIVAVAPGSCKISVKSQGVTSNITVIVLPNKVNNIKRVAATKQSIKLSWKKQKGISGYEVWMYDPDLEEFTKVKTVASDFSSANIIQLKKGTTYKFRVRGFVKSGSKKYYGEFGKTYKLKTNK